MAKKEVMGKIKLQIPGGQATPAPPVGPALGQYGVAIQDFIGQFNERTKNENGMIIPVEIEVYRDRTFSFICKSPPASVSQRVGSLMEIVGMDMPFVNGKKKEFICRLKLPNCLSGTGEMDFCRPSSLR